MNQEIVHIISPDPINLIYSGLLLVYLSQFAVQISESEKAINTVPHKLEIEYGSTDGQKLDILGTDLPDGKDYTHLPFYQNTH